MSTIVINNNNIGGYVAPYWEKVRTVFEENLIDGLDIGASLSIYHRGECVVDLYGGWKDFERKNEPYTSDTLQVVFSLSKGIIAAATAVCVEKGWLDYDTPVAKYWPEFGTNGKENITVSDVLSHRAGLPYINQPLTLEDACNWSKMIDLLVAEKPHWKPRTIHGYHGHTTGYIAGELIHRVDPQYRSYSQFVREELDREYYVGISDQQVEARVAPLFEKQIEKKTNNVNLMSLIYDQTLTCSGALRLEQPTMVYNESQVHRAVLPAVNGITNARTLAKIYSLLINDVKEHGKTFKCLLSPKTLTEAITNITPIGESDRTLYNKSTTFSKSGFQTYGDCFQIFGDGVFGHTGYGGSCAFAYPPYQLTYAHVCNQLDPLALTIDPRSMRAIEAIENIVKELIDSSV